MYYYHISAGAAMFIKHKYQYHADGDTGPVTPNSDNA